MPTIPRPPPAPETRKGTDLALHEDARVTERVPRGEAGRRAFDRTRLGGLHPSVPASPARSEPQVERSARAPSIPPAPPRGGAGARRAIKLELGLNVPGTPYRIERWLGEGGMGVVYEATHTDIDKRVAIKVLRVEACRNPVVLGMFRDEARAASRIGSEYITQVFDFAELPDGRLMFAMELLDGCSVTEELERDGLERGGMDPPRVLGILRQVCKGLAAAHASGIIHRDVKPDNILLMRGPRRADGVKLLDFGISTVMYEQEPAAVAVAGTPSYAAPELISGTVFDARVDMYGFGCTAFEMLTGRPPFEAETVGQILRDHLEREPPPMVEVNPEAKVPLALEHVIRRCLAKLPQDRYADMADLEAALCEAQIEARLRTLWDDLPLPEGDATRLAVLLRKMTKLRHRRGGPTWRWPALAGVALALSAGVAYPLFAGSEPADDGRASAHAPPAPGELPGPRAEEAVAPKSPATPSAHDPVQPEPTPATNEVGHQVQPASPRRAASAELAAPQGKRSRGRRRADRRRAEGARAGESSGAGAEDASDASVAAEALATRGTAAFEAGRRGAAERLFRAALATDWRSPEALIGLSAIYFERARYTRAASYAERAVALRPRAGDYRVLLGDAYYKLYRYEDALAQYRRAAGWGHPGAAKRVDRASARLRGGLASPE